MSQEKFFFFWGKKPFSQWTPSKFTVDGVEYNCAEQYMMAMKAKYFGDSDMQQQIMEAVDPADQKRLGRQVRGFDAERWNRVCKEVVYKANYAKFKQNPAMLEKLLATAGTTLVEASPKDKIWGIGLDSKDPRCLDRSTWQGTNWLGEILTRVRDDIAEEQSVRHDETVQNPNP